MTPQQIQLVEQSLVALGPRLDDVVSAFYARLFELDPAAERLFPDIATQRDKFAVELAFIVTLIRRHDEFVTTAGELGRRHDSIGVQPTHFRAAGVALLDALAATLGASWTTELATAWRLAYRLTAEAMMEGARPAR